MVHKMWWIFKYEFKLVWLSWLVTLVATIFLGMIFVIPLEDLAAHMTGEILFFNPILLDTLLVILTPYFTAIFMSKPYIDLKTIKGDPFGKKLALYRTMPVPIQALTSSRMLLMLFNFLTLSIAFYGTMSIFLSDHFYERVPPTQFFLFILFWCGYALALGAINAFIESGTNGKMLYATSFAFAVIAVTFIITHHYRTGTSITELILQWIGQTGWIAPFVTIGIGIIACIAVNIVLQKRLNHRDYF